MIDQAQLAQRVFERDCEYCDCVRLKRYTFARTGRIGILRFCRQRTEGRNDKLKIARPKKKGRRAGTRGAKISDWTVLVEEQRIELTAPIRREFGHFLTAKNP